jgi:hypothetical protein
MCRITSFCVVVSVLLALAGPAAANELTDWMAEQASDDFLADEQTREDYEADDLPDPGQSMRLRMHEIADADLRNDENDALHPCGEERSERRRLYCWSSHGRNLQISLIRPAAMLFGALVPRTLYSYKSVDLRFPPALRLHLPLDNATSTFGYEDERFGLRLRWKF